MPPPARQLLIVAAATLVFFTNLGQTALWDDEEPRNATCAREMLARGDWIVPTFNAQVRMEKPPLAYWLIMIAQEIWGEGEFSARFFSALAAVGTCVLTYQLGKGLFGSAAGLWAGFALATALAFGFTGRAATADSPLIFCMTLAIYLFARSVPGLMKASAAQTCWRDFVGIYATLGVAVLCRGLVGLLPLVAIIVYTMWRRGAPQAHEPHSATGWGMVDGTLVFLRRMCWPGNVARAIWQLRPISGLLIVAAITLPWGVAVHDRTGLPWNFIQPPRLPAAAITIGLPVMLAGFFPWSIFLPLSLLRPAQRIFARADNRAAYVLLCSWLLTVAALYPFFEPKLTNYLLPAYPALAVLVGVYLEQWFATPGKEPKFWMRAAFVTLAFVGACVLIGMPIATSRLLPGETLIGLPGLIPLVGGCAGLIFLETKRYRRAIIVTAATAVLLSTTVFGFVSLRLDRFQNSSHLVATLQNQAGSEAPLATFGYMPASLVYYSPRPVQFLRDPEELANYWSQYPSGCIIATSEAYFAVKSQLPVDVATIFRQPRFLLEDGELLVLCRSAAVTRLGSGEAVKR